MVVFATCFCKSEAFVIPKNETEGLYEMEVFTGEGK